MKTVLIVGDDRYLRSAFISQPEVGCYPTLETSIAAVAELTKRPA